MQTGTAWLVRDTTLTHLQLVMKLISQQAGSQATNGFYTYTMSAAAAGISGDGTWFFDLQNGWNSSGSNANYDLDIILFGVCDQGDCMDPLAL